MNRNQSSMSRLFNFRVRKPKAKIGNLISVCPGKRHAWFESNVGPVRKPIQEEI